MLQCLLAPAQDLLREYFNEAMLAKERGDNSQYLITILKADSIRPGHQLLQYYVASAYALAGDLTKSIQYLRSSVVSKGDIDLQAGDFDALRQTTEFQYLLDLQHDIMAEVSTSELAFALDEDDFHAEGLAYDPAGERFFVGSIHKRVILEVSETTKETKVIADSTDGLWSVFGLTVDTLQNVLWAASTSSKYMIGYDSTLAGKSTVIKYSLETGSRQSYYLDDGLFHWFGDLTLDSKGNLYISDSESNSIYVIWADTDKLELFYKKDGIRSLQGLTVSADDRFLFYSDYNKGVNRINLSSMADIEIKTDLDISLKSIDGIYYHNNSLVVTQNLIVPMRVCQLILSGESNKIIEVNYLEKNNLRLNEPTLGVIKDNWFYYVANSLWRAYNRDGSVDVTLLEEIQILKTELKESRQ
jgi:sugar lactone lactonase YvrE